MASVGSQHSKRLVQQNSFVFCVDDWAVGQCNKCGTNAGSSEFWSEEKVKIKNEIDHKRLIQINALLASTLYTLLVRPASVMFADFVRSFLNRMQSSSASIWMKEKKIISRLSVSWLLMRSIQWHLFIRFGQRRRRETQKDRSKEESKSVTYSIVRNALLLYWCDEALIHTACHSYIPHSAMFRLNIVSFSVGLRGPRHGGGWRAIHRHRHRQNILFILVRMPRVEKKQIAKNARLVFIMAANLSPVLLGSFIWGAFTQFNSIRFINVNPFRQPHSHCPLNIQFATLLFFFFARHSRRHTRFKRIVTMKRYESGRKHHIVTT